MSGDLWPCEHCSALIEGRARWSLYLINAHTFEFEQVGNYCSVCAEAEYERGRPRILEPDDWAVKAVLEMMTDHYAEPVIVRWLGWGEHRFRVQVRRQPLDRTEVMEPPAGEHATSGEAGPETPLRALRRRIRSLIRKILVSSGW
jgi:hypothetical protein